jgi:hypothetical protein
MVHKSLVKRIPERFSRKRLRMTYVLGMRCSGGLVLCADSMEGDGIGKHYVQKLQVVGIDGQWGLCWGCSGSGDVIRKFNSAVKAALAQETYDKAKIELQMEATLKSVREGYPYEDRIDIVAGLYGRSFEGIPEYWLYRGRSNSTCFAPEKRFAVAGSDVTVSDFLLENIYDPLAHVDYCQRLGVVATGLMKRHAEGVDGMTSVFSYRVGSDGWEPMLDDEVAAVEALFPLSQLDEAVNRFWFAHPGNRRLLDEMNQAEILKSRSLPSVK